MIKDFLYPLRCWHGRMYEKKQEKKRVSHICTRIKQTPLESALYVLTPTHGNLGDHAITKACIMLFAKFQIPFIEITTQDLILLKKYQKLGVMNHHLILVNGGGNLGTLWFSIEILFREIIKFNPDSQIICLPNTIYYEDSEWGREELEKSIEIYNNHLGLKLFAREKISFDIMNSIYRDVVLIPDMAFSLNECKEMPDRHGCLLCLRKDVERTRTEAEEKEINKQAVKLFGNDIIISDMLLDHNIPIERRNAELDIKFNEFRHAKLVITDRLHGMIFAAITGTPCILIKSKSPKVKGCYEWISQLEYIKFADSCEDIEKIYKQIPEMEFVYDNDYLKKYYETLGGCLASLVKKG